MTRTRKKPNLRARLIAAAYEHGVNTFDRREIRRFRAEWVRQAVADRAARTGTEGRCGGQAVTQLSDRLAALPGPDREVDREVSLFLYTTSGITMYHAWTSDLNVIVAEIERRGWSWYITRQRDAEASVYLGQPDSFVRAPTPCLALLRALAAAVERVW